MVGGAIWDQPRVLPPRSTHPNTTPTAAIRTCFQGLARIRGISITAPLSPTGGGILSFPSGYLGGSRRILHSQTNLIEKVRHRNNAPPVPSPARRKTLSHSPA